VGLPLHPYAERAIEIFNMIEGLKHLGLQDTICRLYDVTTSDLYLLALITQTLQKTNPPPQPEN
jgi:ABC-type microcin C transport system permease subunit YejB